MWGNNTFKKSDHSGEKDWEELYKNEQHHGQWWEYLEKDQFNGMKNFGHDLSHKNLSDAGITGDTIGEKMSKYEIKKGHEARAHAAGKSVKIEDTIPAEDKEGKKAEKKEEKKTPEQVAKEKTEEEIMKVAKEEVEEEKKKEIMAPAEEAKAEQKALAKTEAKGDAKAAPAAAAQKNVDPMFDQVTDDKMGKLSGKINIAGQDISVDDNSQVQSLDDMRFANYVDQENLQISAENQGMLEFIMRINQ